MSQRNKNKELISGTIVYAVGSFGTKILSFLLVPLYTYYISREDMGRYDLLITTVSLLVPLLTLQIGDGAYKALIRDDEDSDKILGSTYSFLFIQTVVVLALGAFLYFIFGYGYTVYLVALLLENSMYTTLQKVLRGLQNQKLFAGVGIIYTAIFLGLNVFQICILKRGIEGMFISAIVAYGISIVVILLLEKRTRLSHFPFDKNNLDRTKSLLRFAIPLVPNQLNWWIMSYSDRYVIKFFMGNEWNGLYAVAYKFPTMLQSILGLFTASWQDLSVSDKDDNQGDYYSAVFDKYARFVFSLLLVLIPASGLFIKLAMSESYKETAVYVPFLYLGCAFQSFSGYFGTGYLRDGNTKGASMTSIYGAVINIIVNIVLIKSWGLQAAAFSTFVGFLAMWLFRVFQTRHSLQIKLNLLSFVSYALGALLFAILEIYAVKGVEILMLVAGTAVFVVSNKYILSSVLAKLARRKRSA